MQAAVGDDFQADAGGQLEKENRNFVRAAHLAAVSNLDAQQVRSLQRAAVRQYLEEFHNFIGAERLISEYKLSNQEVRAIVEELLSKPELAKQATFCFDRGKPAHLSVADQIRRFAARYLQQR
jgi:hypothetical protein